MMRIGTGRRAWLNLAVLLGMLGSALSAGAVVSIHVNSATGVPGGTATFFVTLGTNAGEQVAAVENTITFGSMTPIASCIIRDFLVPQWDPTNNLKPKGCTPLVNCSQANFVLLMNSLNGATIPNGALYQCTVSIVSAADTSTSYVLTCSDPSAGDLAHNPLEVECMDGEVQVVPVLVAHALQGATTLTLTSPAPTSRAFAGLPKAGTIIQIDGTSGLSISYKLESDNVTLTLSVPLPVAVAADNTEITLQPLPTPTPTATVTPTPTATPKPGGGGGGGGCQIASVCQSYMGLLLMTPAVLLWSLRRRCR